MSTQYDKYLNEHISAVSKAVEWMLDNNLNAVRGVLESDVVSYLAFRDNMLFHDSSKFNADEYKPYDAYFYGEPDEDAFNAAWLHHIHHNPHHWQHWVLINDEGEFGQKDKMVALEMPKQYVLEMVADWWSFSWRSGNLYEIFRWYDEHKERMVLHPKTKEYVERVLDEIRDKLDGEEDEC